METIRQTAIQAKISDIINSRFVRKEGMDPSYVLTDLGQKISRVKIVGTIVDKFVSEDGNFSSVTVDDDSGSVRVKAFREDSDIFDNFELGDLVLVVGRVREYVEENYVVPEIVKKIADPNYECLHRLEVLNRLLRQRKLLKFITQEKEKFSDLEELRKYVTKKHKVDQYTYEGIVETLVEENQPKREDAKSKILQIMEEIDQGEGVKMRNLLEKSGVSENIFEETINEMLSDGICYEPKPGVLKIT